MWISVATPVTNRMNVIDSGSARNPNSTFRPPDGNQVKRFDDVLAVLRREVAQREEHDDRHQEREAEHRAGDPAGDRFADALAEQQQEHRAEQRQGGDEPDQIEDVVRAHRLRQPFSIRTSSAVAPRRRRKIATMIAEADRDLGRRDHQREEHEGLAADVVELAGEGDEREVHRVEHQLDAHEHHEHVAPDEHADRADREDHRREHQVVGVGDPHGRRRLRAHASESSSASSTASTSSSTISTG